MEVPAEMVIVPLVCTAPALIYGGVVDEVMVNCASRSHEASSGTNRTTSRCLIGRPHRARLQPTRPRCKSPWEQMNRIDFEFLPYSSVLSPRLNEHTPPPLDCQGDIQGI